MLSILFTKRTRSTDKYEWALEMKNYPYQGSKS